MSSKGGTRTVLSLALIVGVMAAGYAVYSNRTPATGAEKAATPAAAPVTIASVVSAPFQIRARTIGTVSIDASVQIKSQVDGRVLEAPFSEGQMVHKGDLLFRLDPALFEAQVKQAEAALVKDQANLANAQADLQRFTDLAKKGFATAQQQETAMAQTKVLTAAIVADHAAIDIAKLQLSYTTISSPMDGKTGKILVQPGNLVKANDTGALVVINQLQPIAVDFSLPQQDLPSLQKRMAKHKLSVAITIPGDTGNGPPMVGNVDFINNAVDTATGTITLKAEFDNTDLKLVPGQLVNVSILLATIDEALQMPKEAVNQGQDGQYVYLLMPDGTVTAAPIKVAYEDGDHVVVSEGVKAGDKVVTDGQLRLAPGVRVDVKSAAGSS